MDFFSRVRVFARGREKCLNMLSENMGRGGIFVCGKQILPAGTRVALEVETKLHGLFWIGDAEVVWNQPIRRGGMAAPPGMGVRFIQVSPRSGKLIEEEVRRALTRRPRPGRVRRQPPLSEPPTHPDPRPARRETGEVARSSLRRYLLQLLVAVIAGVAVGAFAVSAIYPKMSAPTGPSRVMEATALPKPARMAPRPRPAKTSKPKPPPARVEKVAEVVRVSGPPSVGTPEFERTARGWRMVLEASAPVKIRHFELKNPPRLAVDVYKTEYTGGHKRLRSPAKFISRVRVGEQPGFVRFVLDFKGRRIPRHKVYKKNGRAVVSFF